MFDELFTSIKGNAEHQDTSIMVSTDLHMYVIMCIEVMYSFVPCEQLYLYTHQLRIAFCRARLHENESNLRCHLRLISKKVNCPM